MAFPMRDHDTDLAAEYDGEMPLPKQGEPATAARQSGLAVVSAILSGMGFLTLLKLADRSNRTPAKALGLFLATSLESTGGTIVGLTALRQIRSTEPHQRGRMLAAAGVAVGVLTSVLTLNWMRMERRM